MSSNSTRPGTDERRVATAEIIRMIQRLVKATYQFTRRGLAEYGASGPELWALRTLAESEEMTVGGLADRMYLHIATVSVIANRLGRRGLVERQRSAADRRVLRLRITDKGRELVARTPVPPRARLPHGLEKLPLEDLKAMQKSMNLLGEVMGISRTKADAEE